MTAIKSGTPASTLATKEKKPTEPPQHALRTGAVPVDGNSVGNRWIVQDFDRLAGLIALIAMGQALHAAKVIRDLTPAEPAMTEANLILAAKRQLQIHGTTTEQRNASRWRRDGFLFESISWIAARQESILALTSRIPTSNRRPKASTVS